MMNSQYFAVLSIFIVIAITYFCVLSIIFGAFYMLNFECSLWIMFALGAMMTIPLLIVIMFSFMASMI